MYSEETNAIEDILKSHVKKIIEVLPCVSKDRIKTNLYIWKDSNNYKQAFLNSLNSTFDNNYHFSLSESKIDLKEYELISEYQDSNIILNTRYNSNEYIFRYNFGYIPKFCYSKNCFYKYSSILPFMKNDDQNEYIFVYYKTYEPYFDIDYLEEVKYNENYKYILMSMPIFIKYFENIMQYIPYQNDIINKIINILEQYNNKKIINKIKELSKNLPRYIIPSQIDKNNYYFMIFAHYLDKYLLDNINSILDDETMGYILNYLFKKISRKEFNLNLPTTINIDSFEFNANNFLDKTSMFYRVNENKKRVTFQDNVPEDKDDIIIIDQQNPEDINISNIGNLLFSGLNIENYLTSSSYNNFITDLINRLSVYTNYNLIKIKINNEIMQFYVINIDSSDINDNNILYIYNLYFKIITEISDHLRVNFAEIHNSNEIKESFKLLSKIILINLDIFYKKYDSELESIKNFRDNLKYYNIVKRNIISSNISNVNLYTSIINIINCFKKYYIYSKIGGSENNIEIMDPKFLNMFNFFHYVYFLDGIRYDLSIIPKTEYYDTNLSNINSSNLFWDGISKMQFNNLNDMKKSLISSTFHLMFLKNTSKGLKCYNNIENDPSSIERISMLPCVFQNKFLDIDILYYLYDKNHKGNLNEINIDDFLIKIKEILKNQNINILSSIKNFPKIENPKITLEWLKYNKNKNSQTNSDNDEETMLSVLGFILYLLKKFNFQTKYDFNKTNLIIKVSPELNFKTFENLSGGDNTLVDNNELIDFLISSSIIKKDENNKKFSQINLALNKDIKDIETDINYFDTNIKKNVNNICEKLIKSCSDDILKSETIDLENDLSALIITNNLTVDNIYKIIPKYIKTQINLLKDNNIFEDKNEKIIGGESENKTLYKIIQQINKNEIKKKEELTEEQINILTKEKIIKSLNNSYLYDINDIINNNNIDILKKIIISMNHIEKIYNLKISDDVKDIIKKITAFTYINNTMLYEFFTIIKVIKNITEKLYFNTGIKLNNEIIDVNTCSSLSDNINDHLVKRTEEMKGYIDKTLEITDLKKSLENVDCRFFSRQENIDKYKGKDFETILLSMINLYKTIKTKYNINKENKNIENLEKLINMNAKIIVNDVEEHKKKEYNMEMMEVGRNNKNNNDNDNNNNNNNTDLIKYLTENPRQEKN